MGNIYTRIMNPTQGVFEARMSALEGGTEPPSVFPAPSPFLRSGCRDACDLDDLRVRRPHRRLAALYGGTFNLLHYTLPKMGITVSFIDDPDDLDAWSAAVQDNTKAFFGETLPNPKNNVIDIAGIAGIAHQHGVPLIVDNTAASPYLCRPIEHGADIVVHSATKYIGGHGTSIGGVIIDGGDRLRQRHVPELHRARPELPRPRLLARPRAWCLHHQARVQILRDLGAATTPFNSFMFLQGLETLSLRMERHVENAQKVAEYLSGRDEVESVNYAGLPDSPWHERATELFGGRGYGAIPSFVLKGGLDAGKAFVEALELHSHVANIGDVRSLVIHPASPPTPSSPTTSRRQRASHQASSDSASASNTSTTSSPTSKRIRRRLDPAERSSEPGAPPVRRS